MSNIAVLDKPIF